MIIMIILVVVLMVAAVAGIIFLDSQGQVSSTNPNIRTVGLVETGSGTMKTGVTLDWGVGQKCTASSVCQIDNFTLSASTGVDTGEFGFKITTRGGSMVTDWIIVLWDYTGTIPLAAYAQANSTWAAATGQILPIEGLQDDGVMLISAPGTILVGSNDTLSSFGTGSSGVSGWTTL